MTETLLVEPPLNADDFLEHFGIKGMHWGVRHQPSAVRSAAKAQRFQARATRGEGTLRAANAFNSPSVAIGMKAVGLVMAGVSVGMAVRSLRNPSPGTFKNIKMGMTAAGIVLTGVQAASIVRDVGDISAYKKSTQGGGPR